MKKSVRTLAYLGVLAALCLCSLTGSLAAQEPLPAAVPGVQPTPEQRFFDWTALSFAPGEYRARREALMDRLWDSGGGTFLALSASGRSGGETFRQADDFLYFTGLELPGSVLVVDSDARETRLFVPDRDPRFESRNRPNDFPGRPLGKDTSLARLSGIAEIWSTESLALYLQRLERDGRTLRIDLGSTGTGESDALGLGASGPIPDLTRTEQLLLYLKTADSTLTVQNAFRDVARLRMVKSKAEIDVLRRATHVTVEAIKTAAREVREGVTERQLEGVFEGACKAGGAQRLAFASIIKSGPNSLWPWRILAAHYDRRNRAMHDGELVIFDVGCERDYYASDVGRTFPVSGHFSDAQREILALEVAVSDAIIAAIRPGVTFRDLREVALAAIPPEQRPYMQADLYFGHHIGLSVADPALPELPLEPGMVFTVEPWYYNHERGISVFTEDDVLVTPDGVEVLTRELPRRPEELERMVGAASGG